MIYTIEGSMLSKGLPNTWLSLNNLKITVATQVNLRNQAELSLRKIPYRP